MKKSLLVGMALVAVLALIGWAVWPGSSLTARAAQLGQTTTTAQATAVAPSNAAPVAQGAPAGIADLQAALQNLYDNVNPSVVNVNVLSDATSTAFGGQPDIMPNLPNLPNLPFNHPGLPDQQGTPQFAESLGSGFVWDTQGHIVTNNHVVDGATKISVTFSDGLTLPAELVGRDVQSDLAVIKVDPSQVQLKPVTVADSTKVKVGEFVVAIGNPFGLEGSMTFGIVSALGRSLPANSTDAMMGTAGYTIPDIIQTDAPVNPGNSGGALLDLNGQLVGVPTAIESAVRSSSGVGLAIPSVIVNKVVPSLIEKGSFEHPYIGISGGSLRSELATQMGLPATQRGALVVTVAQGGPAEKAGLRGSTKQVDINGQQFQVGGDVIIAVDNQPVRDFEDLTTYLARNGQVGQTITLTVLRDGKETRVPVTLGARPEQAPQTSLQGQGQQGQQGQGQQGQGQQGQGQQGQGQQGQGQQGQGQQGQTGGAWLGVSGATVTSDVATAMGLNSDTTGVLVVNVVSNSPAAKAGLKGSGQVSNQGNQQIPVGGDIITQVNGKAVTTIQDLVSIVQNSKPGDQLALTILRDGQTQDVTVTLGSRP